MARRFEKFGNALASTVSTQLSTLVLTLTALLVCPEMSSQAQIVTWDGGSGDWHDPTNWDPNRVPADGDDVVVPGGHVQIQNPTANVSSLYMDESAYVQVSGYGPLNVVDNSGPFTMGGETTVAGRSSLQVYYHGGSYDFRTGSLDILDDDSELQMWGGIARINRIAEVASGASIKGFGTIVFDGNFLEDTSVLESFGTIDAGFDTADNEDDLLTFRVTGNGYLDIDGRPSTRPEINAVHGSIQFDGPIRDAFGGTLKIGAGRYIEFSEGWTLAAPSDGLSGQLLLEGTSTAPAVLAGGESILKGEVWVPGSRYATITSPVSFEQEATVILDPYAVLRLEAETSYRGASFADVDGAAIYQVGDATVFENTTIGRDAAPLAYFDLDGEETSPSKTVVESGADLRINTESLGTYNGTLRVAVGATLHMNVTNSDDNWTVGPGGLVTVNGRITGDEVVNDGGILRGNGTIVPSITTNSGWTKPGLSPGALTISGDYTQGTAGGLEIELGGYSQGVDYDLLTIGGNSVLGGTLDVNLVDSFSPVEGDVFEVLTAGQLIGGFNQLDLPPLSSDDLFWSVIYDYDLDAVSLQVNRRSLADFNGDGFVDGSDLGIWRMHFGTSGGATRSTGDADGDGDVDGRDFLEWQRHVSVWGSAPTLSITSVPEPATLSIGLFSLAVLGRRRCASACQVSPRMPQVGGEIYLKGFSPAAVFMDSRPVFQVTLL